jgi:hypothetical protein
MFHYEGDANGRFGVPLKRHLGWISGALFLLGVVGALFRLRRGGNALLLICALGLLAPQIVAMRLGEKPNLFRSSGVIGPSLVLISVVLRNTRHYLGQAVDWVRERWTRLPRIEAPLNATVVGSGIALAVVALLLALEAEETVSYYFGDHRRALPDEANWSIAQDISETILAFEDGPAYVKTWAHWYDGRALREYLDARGLRWDGEIPEMSRDAPPLAGYRGKMLVILHPNDTRTLDLLKQHFDRWAVKTEHYPLGKAPIIVEFYGEI